MAGEEVGDVARRRHSHRPVGAGGDPGHMRGQDRVGAGEERVVRAQRLTGYRTPVWAALWLWRIGHDREGRAFWKRVGQVAKEMGCPELKEGRK